MTTDEGKSGGTGQKFETECPNCGRNVTFSDEKIVGLWKDCPGCHTQFKVEHLRRVNTDSSSSADDDFITKTVISICVGLVAAIAIALSGHGSALLLTDVAVAAGFVFHVTGLDKRDARHTNYLKLARSIYFLGHTIAILIAFLFYRNPIAGGCMTFFLVGVSTYGFMAGRYGAHSACYALFWSWVVFFGVRVYNPQLLARPAANPPVANGEQQPQNDVEQVVAPVVRVAGQPITPPLQHQNEVRHAAFSPDGRRVVTASEDKIAQVWDATTGQPVTPVLRHQYGLRCAAFSPDGRLIATASGQFAKGEARVWNAETGETVGPPLEHKGLVNHVEFSPDGRYIITASEDRTARVWDVQTGQALTPSLTHEDNVYWGAFSSDGRRIITAGEDMARVWDANTGQPLSPPLHGFVKHAAFSPDGRRILTASGDRTAQVWDIETGKRVTAQMKHDDSVSHGEFSRDGRRIVTTSGYDGRGEARIWDAATGRPLTPPMKHKGNVPHATFSSDGRFVVTASYDNTAIVWDTETGEASIPPLQHREGVYYAAFSPDGERVVTASHDKTARVWYVSQKKPADENKSDPKPVQHAKTETQQEKDEAEIELLLINELAKSTDPIPKARELALRLLEPLSVAEAQRKARGNVCPRAQMLPLLPRLGLTIDESRRHVRRLLQDGDERIALVAPDALVKLAKDQADVADDVTAMLKIWNSGSVEFREAVRKSVGELAPRDQPHLFSALKSDDAEIRIPAGEVLGLLGSMQKLDLSQALKYWDDERAAPVVLEAVFCLKPFPKEGLPLLISGLRGKPALASTVGEILKKSSTDDLKPLVPDLTKLMDHTDLGVQRAALDGLASAGALAIPYLAERVRSAKADQARDYIYAVTFERACSLVKSSDKEIVPFLVKSVVDDDESKASQAIANAASGALNRLAKDAPSVVSASELVASFAGKSDDSPGARRVQRIFASMGEAGIKDLIRGTESKDESVCVWSMRTVPLVPEFFSNGLVIDQANEFAKLAFESRSERVRLAGYSLLHQFPSFQLPQSTLPIIKKYVTSKDIQKQGWAVNLAGKVATGKTKSPKSKK